MKKRISLMLVVSLLVNMSIGIYALHEAENYVPITQITTEELTNCALNLAREIAPYVKLTIGDDIIPIYDQADTLIGYSLEYYHGETPYGFLNLDFRKENPIVDFSISEGCDGIYDSIVDTVCQEADIGSVIKSSQFLNKQSSFEKKMYAMGVGIYGVSTPNSETIYAPINAHKIVEASIVESNARNSIVASYDNHGDIYSNNYSGTVVTAPVFIDQYSSIDSIISQTYIEAVTQRYACAVLALTEIANQENILYNNSIADTFLELWDDTNTMDSPIDFGNGVLYGSTYTNDARAGMITYLTARGYDCFSDIARNASFNFFKEMVDSDCSGMLFYGVSVNNVEEQHAINVFGYCVTRVSGVLANYIIVADGWNFATRYLCYSDTDFTNTTGLSFMIS